MEIRDEFEIAKEGEFLGIKKFDEVKVELKLALAPYKYAMALDYKTKQEVKKDLAQLRKVRKAIEDKRIAAKKEFDKPFMNLVDQVKELVAVLDETIGNLDNEIKEYEAVEKAHLDEEKAVVKADLRKEFDELGITWLNFNKVWTDDLLDVNYDLAKDKLLGKAKFIEGMVVDGDEELSIAFIQSGFDMAMAIQLVKARKYAIDTRNKAVIPF